MTDTTQQPQDQQSSTTTDHAAAAAAAPPPAYYETFQDQALKTNPRWQRLATMEDVAKSLIHAEKTIGLPADQVLRFPTDPNDKEAVRAIQTKLGLPEKVDGYGIDLGEKATDADKAVLGEFLKVGHEAGLSKAQAEPLVRWWTEQTVKVAEAQQQAMEAQRVESDKLLRTEWGASYDTKSKEIGRLANELGGKELAAELTADKLGNHPQLAKMLGAMVDRMAEPGAPGGRSGDAAPMNAGKLTPTQAGQALNALEADPVRGKAIFDKGHPQHADALRERNRLLRMQAGLEPDQS